MQDNQQYNEAMVKYEQLVEEDPEGIWADNSLYAMGQLYLDKLDQPQKAMDLFEKIFLDYDSSTFAVDARKKYRELKAILQGDSNSESPLIDSLSTPSNDTITTPPSNQN